VTEATIYQLKQYLSYVDQANRALSQHFEEADVFAAYRLKRIPKEGKLVSPELTYCFHGSGCYVTFEVGALTVNFDFGPGGRTDGMDPWKVSIFYQDNEVFEEPFDSVAFERQFLKLVDSGKLINPGWSPGVSLHYFREFID